MHRLVVLLALAGSLLPSRVALAHDATPGASPGAVSGDFVGNVDIGGRTLNLECFGAGGPTVVFEAGLGDNVFVWSRVQPEVAIFARACAYDRANVTTGFSDPTTDAVRTAADAAADLHTLLGAAGVPGPYVLVAHAFGGTVARVYASRYPAEVAGLVLVDVTPPELDPTVPLDDPEAYPRFVRGENPERMDLLTSGQQVAEATVPPVPVVALMQDPTIAPPGWQAMQEEQARQLNARLVVVEGAGHRIHELRPELVVDAVRQVIDAVRDAATPAPAPPPTGTPAA